MAIDHYENFPVASILLPRRLRTAVHNVYRYARTADDIADEGDALPEERLDHLARYRAALQQMDTENCEDWADTQLKSVFSPLARTVQEHKLPLRPFADLLSAFEQDVYVSRYHDREALLAYCRLSANPVGHIMLHLYGVADDTNVAASDAICTGLQLVNFWQDVAIDCAKGRIYIPLDALRASGLDEEWIAANTGRTTPLPPDTRWHSLMREQVQYARELLLAGLPLGRRLPGRTGYELRMIVQGGLRILERLDALAYDVFFQRPTLSKRDWLRVVWRAI